MKFKYFFSQSFDIFISSLTISLGHFKHLNSEKNCHRVVGQSIKIPSKGPGWVQHYRYGFESWLGHKMVGKIQIWQKALGI